MSSSAIPEVVKLRELGDIVSAVPHLLGFHPTESLVAVSLRGPRERLSFSLRLDLLPSEHDDEVASMFAERMKQAKADAVLLFVYTDAPHDGVDLPRRQLIETLVRRLPMPVRDAVLVTAERLWSYVCADPHCCPPEGRRRDPQSPGTLALQAAHALHGDAVLPSRDAVVAAVSPIGGIAARSMQQALNRAAAAYACIGASDFLESSRQLMAEVMDRYADPPARLSDDETAQLVLALHDHVFRDEALLRCRRDEDLMRTLLQDLARRAMPPSDAPVCTLLGFVAYLKGEGVVAMTALERALDTDPSYSLARLLLAALQRQMTPRELRRILTQSVRRSARPARQQRTV
ncbi:MAG TPA: DUF4192 domain-containing protein [Mycobacteriales bacterium]|nr:DUF4192 domain-containing protein [Mycobacteriales bacterium]